MYPHLPKKGLTEDTENTEKGRKAEDIAIPVSVPSVSSVRDSVPFAVVMLYGNVLVRRGRMIDRCVEMLVQTGCDSVRTIAPVGKMHPYWMFDKPPSHP